ncbi:hypothetical protein QYE76_040370 [Lolium multiflorum]|uniref:CCHC-type domain-containing protein n=1 Tax=Lolium multiflorum TaxID=4521 RepID=A0AAD8TCU5_LOLMU|nr:hypothetical protein QYE76_040370 [Lolium multiflorum]
MQDRGKGTYVRESGEQTKTKPAMISCFGGQVAAEPDEATVQTINRLVQEFQTMLDSMDGRDLGPDEQLEILDELSRGHEELDRMFPWRRSRWRATKAALLSIFGRNRGRSKVKPAGEDGGITAHHLICRNTRFWGALGATTGSTTSSSDDEFLHTDNFFPDLSDFFDNLNMGDNDAAAKEQEKFEKVDAMFKTALFSILGDNIVDPYMAFDHGKDAWDALEAKFGVSDAGTELYVMEQYYDYRMTDERSVVEQAHEIQSLAKELEQFKCKFDEKNKASNSTNFKRKTPYKKKGNCHVCGAPGHWAPDCPERHDRRGNSGKSANVVIGVDTEMKDVGYGRKDFLRANGKRLTCLLVVLVWESARRDCGHDVVFGREFLHTDNFFPDLSDFFDNLNMGDNDAAAKREFQLFAAKLCCL